MGEVIKLRDGATVGERAPSLRHQAGGCRQSQFVSIGTAARRLLDKLERQMNERAITKA